MAAPPIPSPSRRGLTRPTGHEVVRHLQSLQILQDATGKRVIARPARLQPTLIAILTALQMPATIFIEPRVRDGPDERGRIKLLIAEIWVRNRYWSHGAWTLLPTSDASENSRPTLDVVTANVAYLAQQQDSRVTRWKTVNGGKDWTKVTFPLSYCTRRWIWILAHAPRAP